MQRQLERTLKKIKNDPAYVKAKDLVLIQENTIWEIEQQINNCNKKKLEIERKANLKNFYHKYKITVDISAREKDVRDYVDDLYVIHMKIFEFEYRFEMYTYMIELIENKSHRYSYYCDYDKVDEFEGVPKKIIEAIDECDNLTKLFIPYEI
jgi:hypothetical protein